MVKLPVYKRVLTEQLKPFPRNSRLHSAEQVQQLCDSMENRGFTNPILIDEDNMIIAGHCRLMAAKQLGMPEVPCIVLDGLSEIEKAAYVIADNKLALNATWDIETLLAEVDAILAAGFGVEETAFTTDEIEELRAQIEFGENVLGTEHASLADKFMVPPFSVLDARQGYWQERKNKWLALGIKGERGRNAECLNTGIGSSYGRKARTGVSIFDPVLCELAYRWFSPENGTVLDPFAGGSVRGIVAGKCNRSYFGVDLRAEQVDENNAQLMALAPDKQHNVFWKCGDSKDLSWLYPELQADLIFTCPPYHDLEVYSDDPNDLSNMDYKTFLAAYTAIIATAYAHLANDRFACFVVGDIRDKKGIYRNFVSDTIGACIKSGLKLYNEAILVTSIGSLPVRAGKQFNAGRKLGKTHQNVLVFVKGDPKEATRACGAVEVYDATESD